MFPKLGVSPNGLMENPIKHGMIWGVPLFLEIPNFHIIFFKVHAFWRYFLFISDGIQMDPSVMINILVWELPHLPFHYGRRYLVPWRIRGSWLTETENGNGT